MPDEDQVKSTTDQPTPPSLPAEESSSPLTPASNLPEPIEVGDLNLPPMPEAETPEEPVSDWPAPDLPPSEPVPAEPTVPEPEPEPVSSAETELPPTEEAGLPPAEVPGQPSASAPLSEVKAPDEQPLPELDEEKPKGSFFKKILLVLLVLSLLAGAGFGVYRFVLPRFQTAEEVTLTYWGLWEPERVMRGVIQEWEKENPKIKVVYQPNSPQEYRQRLQSALATAEGPDIFRYHLTWVPMLKNQLEPLPPSVMSSSLFESSYYPVLATQLRSGGNYLGLPLMVDSLALFYNEDIFLAAGKTPPSTWEELRRLALELTVKDEQGRIQTAGVALGTANNVDHWSDILGLMMLQNGADLSAPGACSTQGEEEVCLGADALTFYTVFSSVDQVWDMSLPNSTLAFSMGKLAMYFAPSWRIFDLKVANPGLNFKVIAAPQLSGTNLSWASFWVEGVSQKSQAKEEAWRFLQFLSSAETLEKLYAAQSNDRLFGELYPLTDMADKVQGNPLVAPFVNQMPQAQTWYLCSNTFDNGLNDKMIQYFGNAVDAVNAGQSARAALETAGQGVSQLLSQYGLAAPIVPQ